MHEINMYSFDAHNTNTFLHTRELKRGPISGSHNLGPVMKINLDIELLLINMFLTINFKYYHINFNILLKSDSLL